MLTPPKPTHLAYAQRGTNTLQHLLRFAADYDSRYAKELGNFRMERIDQVVARFLACGDYRQGVARIPMCEPRMPSRVLPSILLQGFLPLSIVQSEANTLVRRVPR